MRDAMVKDLRSREGAATTDAERQRIRASREALASKSSDLTGKVDFEKIAHDIPWLARYLWADAISGPVLNLALLVTGIGLLARKEWARRGAIGVAVLKVVRLILLNGLLALVVVPGLTDACDQIARTDLGGEVVKHVMDRQNASKGAGAANAPQLTPAELIQLMRAFGYGAAFMTLGAGIIYPVVALVVLTRPGARAACQRGAPGTSLNWCGQMGRDDDFTKGQ
jgi:hypothetical protein